MTRRSRGFTLLEVIVVLAVAGMTLLLIAQSLRLGARALGVWRGATEPIAGYVAVEQALRHMIERMDPGLFPEPPLARGTAHSFVFTTTLPDPETGALVAADARLEAADNRLMLWWIPRERGAPFAAPPPSRRLVLLENVARLDLAYAPRGAGAAWRSVWAEETLPGLVRLTLVGAPGAVSWPPIVARAPRERAEE